jgi:hypothetical protein
LPGLREPGRDRQAGVDHRAELTGQLQPTREPVEVQAQRVVHVRQSRTREARCPGPDAARIGREAVDVLARETRVCDRSQARVERQLERIAVQAPSDVALPDPGDRRAPLQDLHQPRSGSKSGR